MSVWGIKFLFSFHFCLYSVLYIVELSKNSSSKTYILLFFRLLLLFSHSVVSDSLWPHGLQYARLPRPSLSAGYCSFMSIESVMPYKNLILCHPLLLSSIFPSIRVFSNELILLIRWLKYWSFSFGISPFNEYSGLVWSPYSSRDLQESSPPSQLFNCNSLLSRIPVGGVVDLGRRSIL